jgi:hypothetical protein
LLIVPCIIIIFGKIKNQHLSTESTLSVF